MKLTLPAEIEDAMGSMGTEALTGGTLAKIV